MVLGCLTQLGLQSSAEPLLEALGQSGDRNVTCGFHQACRSSPAQELAPGSLGRSEDP